jgi:hypothetical protein
MSRAYRVLGFVLSLVLIGLGIAITVRTLVGGGGMLGVILGPMFVAAGAGRIWAARVWSS